MSEGPSVHRPRNLDWMRAAALLYGDWGTSKAYVLGAAFLAIGFSSLPIIVAVCALTALVGYNYLIVCKHFPDGGGVYSAARGQSRILAVVGALMLVANFTVTAALSAWAAMAYFRIPQELLLLATMASLVLIGSVNFFGPKHTGSFAVWLALPMLAVVLVIILGSVPYLSGDNLQPLPDDPRRNWVSFVGVILAFSGVEAIANLTGVMKLDPGSSIDRPSVRRTSRRAILPVAVEVVFGTALLGWAMLSLPASLAGELSDRWKDMLSALGEQYGALAFGPGFGRFFGILVGGIVGLLLLSAVNTAIGALIGLFYLLSRDGEMPRAFTRLNAFGVPWFPILLAAVFPMLVVLLSPDQLSLMELYAIGVVGAIAVNLGSCLMNRRLGLRWHESIPMAVTFLILVAVELTIAKTKPNALFYLVCVLVFGLGLRGYAQRRSAISRDRPALASSSTAGGPFDWPGPEVPSAQMILVAARGLTSVLRFALEEARLRKGSLYVLFVKELAVALPGVAQSPESPRWQEDPHAARIMEAVIEAGRRAEVPVVPVYAVSDNPAATILDLAATLGVDLLVLGSPHRNRLVSLLKGNVVTEVARNLPESIQLLIYG